MDPDAYRDNLEVSLCADHSHGVERARWGFLGSQLRTGSDYDSQLPTLGVNFYTKPTFGVELKILDTQPYK